MVIRRIRQHVATHNWFAVAVDVAIVVIGVFLGTQANNWNADRVERAAAADYRQQIIRDLANNETDMAFRKAYYEAARGHGLAALSDLHSVARPHGEQFLIHAFQASQVWLRPLVRNGYDEMAGAGLSHDIGEPKLRSRLASYYTQIRQFDVTALSSTQYREKVRRVLPYAVQAAIQMKCGDQIKFLSGGEQVATLPDRCELGIDPATVATADSRLLAADIEQDLTRHLIDIDQKLAGFKRFGKTAHRLRLELEAEAKR